MDFEVNYCSYYSIEFRKIPLELLGNCKEAINAYYEARHRVGSENKHRRNIQVTLGSRSLHQ